jgi:hypothetical protein
LFVRIFWLKTLSYTNKAWGGSFLAFHKRRKQLPVVWMLSDIFHSNC